jgi:hypothetical protein
VFSVAQGRRHGEIAQLVEQWTENPRVTSSILVLATTFPPSLPVDFDRILHYSLLVE